MDITTHSLPHCFRLMVPRLSGVMTQLLEPVPRKVQILPSVHCEKADSFSAVVGFMINCPLASQL